VSIPERTHTNGNSAPRLPDGPIAPPQNLEAEQSVLGAVLLSDTALPALIIDERLHAEDFYREAHGIVFTAMLDLHNAGEPVDALTLVEHLKQAGKLEAAGGRSAIDLLAASVPAVGHVRQYARIVRDNAMLRRLLRAAYDIQERVHSHAAAPRELIDIAERSILEVAHEDSRKDFQSIHDVLDIEITKLEQLSREGKSITGTPSGLRGSRQHHRRLPARQPDHPRGAAVDGQERLMANFAEHAALGSNKAVRCSRSRCRSPSSRSASSRRRRPSRATTCARGACPRRAGSKILEASNRLAKSPLFIDDSSDLSVLDVRAKARRLLQQHADGWG
jgi:replicative DNA helicase